MLYQLNLDTLAHVISFLDAPTTVCLALTSHKNYDSVLLICRCKRLEDVCPRDIGKLLPSVIKERSFNILAARGTPTSAQISNQEPAWTIANPRFLEIPDITLRYHGYRHDERHLMVQHLAYIRHVEWYAQQEGGVQSPGWHSQQPSERSLHRFARPLCASMLCKMYIRFQMRSYASRFDEIARDFVLMTELWDQETIDTVEFMVLKQQLGEGWIKTKSTSVLRLKQREKRRAGAITIFKQLSGLIGLGFSQPSWLRRVAWRVLREFGYLGRTFAGLIWIEEHVRDILSH